MTRNLLRTLIVVCARRGSQRLPGKHHKIIAGRKMWEQALGVAMSLHANYPAHIYAMLSTDDRDIIQRSRAEGMWAILRGAPLADPEASIHLALWDATNEHVKYYGPERSLDVVVCLPANVPTVTLGIVLKCIRALKRDPSATAAMTVRPVRDQPEWLWIRGKNGVLKRWGRPSKGFRVQDFPERFHATGTCCAVRTKTLMACRSDAAFAWLGEKIIGVLDPDAIEVHDKRDYEMARAVLERKP